jgi:hypothetical protein
MYSLLKNIVLVYHQEKIIKNIQHLIQIRLVWLDFDGVYCHFQQYFNYIVAVSFIGGENH